MTENTTLPVEEAVVDQPTAEEATPPQQVEKPLQTPIFIGCEDPSVIDKMATTFPDTYELCVMNNEVLFKSKQLWFLGKMDAHERERIEKLRFADDKKKQALELAAELEQFGFPFGIGFRHYDLKNYFTKMRTQLTKGKYKVVNFSNRDTRNLIDTLAIFGFVSTMDAELNFEKRLFMITIDDASRLFVLQQQKSKLENEKAAMELLIADTDRQMLEVSGKLEGEANKLDEAEKVAPPAKTKRKAKKDDKGEAAKGEQDNTTKPTRRTKRTGDSK